MYLYFFHAPLLSFFSPSNFAGYFNNRGGGGGTRQWRACRGRCVEGGCDAVFISGAVMWCLVMELRRCNHCAANKSPSLQLLAALFTP